MLHMLHWDHLPQSRACCSCWGAAELAQNVPAYIRVESVRGTSDLRVL
jgi:hypothetical protein